MADLQGAGGSPARARPRRHHLRHAGGGRGTSLGLALSFTLGELEQAIRESWSLDTADAENDWSPENPGCGQCDITSLVVHDLLGGELLAADVFLDGERVEAHMWNRLPSGIEVDLTRDQFRRGEVIGEPVPRPRPAQMDPTHPRYFRYERYLVLADRVRRRLGLPATASSSA